MADSDGVTRGMDFSRALVEVRLSGRIWRDAWKDDSYVVLMRGYPKGIGINKATAEATGGLEGSLCVFEPYFLRWNDGTESFAPWVPTVQDILAMDWHTS